VQLFSNNNNSKLVVHIRIFKNLYEDEASSERTFLTEQMPANRPTFLSSAINTTIIITSHPSSFIVYLDHNLPPIMSNTNNVQKRKQYDQAFKRKLIADFEDLHEKMAEYLDSLYDNALNRVFVKPSN